MKLTPLGGSPRRQARSARAGRMKLTPLSRNISRIASKGLLQAFRCQPVRAAHLPVATPVVGFDSPTSLVVSFAHLDGVDLSGQVFTMKRPEFEAPSVIALFRELLGFIPLAIDHRVSNERGGEFHLRDTMGTDCYILYYQIETQGPIPQFVPTRLVGPTEHMLHEFGRALSQDQITALVGPSY